MRATSVWGRWLAAVVASGVGTLLLAGGVRAEGDGAPVGAASASSDPGKPVASASASAPSDGPPSADAPKDTSKDKPGAKADPPGDKPGESVIKGPWYGWQSLLTSLAVSGGAIVAYRSFDADKRIPVIVSGIALQIAIAPAIHLGHGNHAAVGRSIALHTALVAGGALLGAYAVQGLAGCPGPQSPCERLDGTDFAALGALVGAIIAPAVDAGWLGFEPAPRGAAPAGASIAPTFGLVRGVGGTGAGGPTGVAGGVLGVAGVF